jgi:hypothetical protein
LGPTVKLPELLELVSETLDYLAKNGPPRASQRERTNVYWPVFIRWLNFFLSEIHLPVSPRQLAAMVNATAGEFADPWTEDKVKAVLRRQPREFKAHKRAPDAP